MSIRPVEEHDGWDLKARIGLGVCILVFVLSLAGVFDRQIEHLLLSFGLENPAVAALPVQVHPVLMTTIFREEHPVAFYVLSAFGAAVVAQFWIILASLIEFLIAPRKLERQPDV